MFMFYFIALTCVEIESLLRARYTVNSYMYTLYKTNNVKICKFNFYSIPLKKFAKAQNYNEDILQIYSAA